jgi:AraC-like DNA-binding protein
MMLLLSGFGIFFSMVLLVSNKGYKSANIYLGLFLTLFNFIILTHYLYIYNNSKVTIAILLSIPINAAAYTIGPLAFLYVRSILKNNAHFTNYDWIHFIVFCIMFLGRLPYNLSDWDSKLLIADQIINNSWSSLSHTSLNSFLPLMINYKLKVIHFLLYIIAIWYLILNKIFKKSSSNDEVKPSKILINWLFFFSIIVSFLVVFLCVLLFPHAKDKLTYQNEGKILFSLVFSGFLVLVLGLILFPQILYGKPLEKVASKVYKNKKAALEKGELISISFDLNYIEKIKLALNYWVEENKFLEVESSIYSISKDINLPFHHITYFFNQVNDEKYIDWRNRLRVEYAINLIKNKKGFHQTIESLGKESGFKSNSAFIRCFKQLTNKLPNEYIKDLKL